MSGYDEVKQADRVGDERSHSTHRGWRDATRTTLIILEVLLSIGAVGGAIALAAGAIDLGASTADLPFASPVFGAVALVVVNGILPAVVVVGAVRRAPWADLGHVAVGLALVGWMIVQVELIGWGSWLQTVYFGYGVLIAGIGSWRLLDR
ncbi:MAG: hypothetical protein ACYC2O_00710 [Microthrixaceae bacterium]